MTVSDINTICRRKLKDSSVPFTALLGSLLFHGLIFGIIFLIAAFSAHAPDTSAMLDIASVDLSFSDTMSAVDGASMPQSIPQENRSSIPAPPSVPEPDMASFPRPAAADTVIPAQEPLPRPAAQYQTSAAPTPTEKPLPDVAATDRVSASKSFGLGGTTGRIDAPASLSRTIRPVYPKSSRQKKEEGTIELEVMVGADGLVKNITLVSSSGYAALDASAKEAVAAAKFRPAKTCGKAVASTARLTFEFRIH